MRDINNSRGPDQTSELGSKVSDVVNKSAKRVGDIITLSTLDYKIIELLEISGQKFARVGDDKEEETYLIFKDGEYRDFINGTSEVAVYSLSTCGTKVRISRKGESFHLHTNGDIRLNSKYD